MLVNTSDPDEYHRNYVQDAVRQWLREHPEEATFRWPIIRVHYCRYAQRFIAANRARTLVNLLPIADGESVLVVGGGFGWMAEALAALLPSSSVVVTDTSPWVQSVKDQGDAGEVAGWLDTDVFDYQTRRRVALDPLDRQLWLDRIATPRRSNLPILDEGLENRGSRNRVLSEIAGARFDHAVSEQALPWLTDAEATGLSEAMREMAADVAHWITPFIPEMASEDEPNPWNWKRVRDSSPTTNLLQNQPWYTRSAWDALLPGDRFFSGVEEH